MFEVVAEDRVGNRSPTDRVSFICVPSDRLLVLKVGQGSIAPNYNNTLLALGTNYSLTATASNGHKFLHWTLTLSGNSMAITSNKLNFTMQPGLILTAVFLDTNRPTVTVTNLVANQQISGTVYAVKGTAADNVGVNNVWYRLNGGGWTLAAGSNPWAAPLQLDQRANTFQAWAEDAAGNRSSTNSVTFIHVFTAPMTVLISGHGTVNSNYNGKWLEIGNTYTMTASNGTGYGFTHWTDGGANVVTNKATVSFVMRSNLVLQANFNDVQKPVVTITNPAANARISNAVATVRGTVSDNGPMGMLWHQYAGGGWQSAPASGTNWSVGVLLASGTNLFRIYAVDAAGNISLTNSRSLVCTLPASALTNVFRITGVAHTNTAWQFHISAGTWGGKRVVEASSNFVNWTAVFTNLSTNSRLDFFDVQGTNASSRFYRVVLP